MLTMESRKLQPLFSNDNGLAISSLFFSCGFLEMVVGVFSCPNAKAEYLACHRPHWLSQLLTLTLSPGSHPSPQGPRPNYFMGHLTDIFFLTPAEAFKAINY